MISSGAKNPKAGAPPDYPWRELRPLADSPSYLCFYYVSPISRLPVREVTRVQSDGGGWIADNKSDPNLETQTFGLFSTCEAGMRAGAVKRRVPFLFFFGQCRTSRGIERCVTGFYALKWFAHGGLHRRDFCLGAHRCHFVEQPVPFRVINQALGTSFSGRSPRLFCLLDPPQARWLADTLLQQKDMTPEYIAEIRRLENFNARLSGGLKYVNFGRRHSFDWSDVSNYPQLGTPSQARRRANNASNHEWHCPACRTGSRSPVPLRLCPICGAAGLLHPLN